MKYTSDEHKKAIKIAVDTFLSSRGTNLRAVARSNSKNYNTLFGQIKPSKGFVDEEKVNAIIALVDPKFKLHLVNKTFLITDKPW